MQSRQGTTANLQYAMTLSTAGPEIQALVPEIRNADKDLTLGWSQTRLPDLDKKCVPLARMSSVICREALLQAGQGNAQALVIEQLGLTLCPFATFGPTDKSCPQRLYGWFASFLAYQPVNGC